MKQLQKSEKIKNVCYDIRGPVLQLAQQMEDDGIQIIKLNIGNLAQFDFMPPDEIMHDIKLNIANAAGYADSKGIFSARKAIMHYCQQKNIKNVTLEDIFIGNGVSELICIAMNALLNNDDEVLIPAPDYPLWTAAVSLAGGKPIHYLCDEQNQWEPNFEDLIKKITNKTKAIVVINPNNPTGALYSNDTLLQLIEIARKNELIICADEIYDKMVYDGLTHTSIAALSEDVLTIHFNGLSKNYRSCGYRAGWMVVSGDKSIAEDYLEGLSILCSMRLCANVPAQYAIQTALGGYQSINELISENGRLYKQREIAYQLISKIPGVSCVKPQATLYLFVKLDPKVYSIDDDQKLIQELLFEEKVLVVQGTGFNWPQPDHFRMVFLPHEDILQEAIDRISNFLARKREAS